jgi:hypothetical protein
VEPKLSKAKLADGTTVQIADASGLIARRVDQSANEQAGASVTSSSAIKGSATAAKPKPNSKNAPESGTLKAGVDC